MFVGGLRALLLQSLHPVAMIAVAQHSDYRNDPWGRLQRTSTFSAATTYGPAEDADHAVERVRRVHRHVTGTGPDGQPYRADDPHLLRWVHVAETDSFLRCHQRYGAQRLDEAGCDAYVADTARTAVALGVPDPPQTRAELEAVLREYRPELRADTGSPGGGPVPGPPPAAAAGGPWALRGSRGGCDRRAAGLGAAGTAAAAPAGRRTADRATDRPCDRERHPVGAAAWPSGT